MKYMMLLELNFKGIRMQMHLREQNMYFSPMARTNINLNPESD